MKKAATILFIICLMGCTSSLMSQVDPDAQISQYRCKILYDGPYTFIAFRGLKGSTSDQWQRVRIPPRWVVLMPLNDCGWPREISCPYELYIFTSDQLTSKIELEGTKSYRIYWDPVKQWQIKEEKR